MSLHDRIDEQIEELSRGRLAFDVRERRLTGRGADGDVAHELEISEVELRGLLQRLLLDAPQPLDDEPLTVAVRLLLDHLDERL
ncbi:hypothetical protein KM427_22945 [Nocardioides sp. LMS-CY]|uniref:Uncharacterized protein n=1 Tax=Nocardioides soli TaxID=1036020 RepID=A0A7W4VUZ3_9ACTN|nr:MULTISPECIES: hypothetical protein [Nocardioides]MBB3042281.1 hypothetical protein [Nocardioides soli]QWF21749.1 hypothetical protein KM427_22945 [Nocardioides sp. LMS-CY]